MINGCIINDIGTSLQARLSEFFHRLLLPTNHDLLTPCPRLMISDAFTTFGTFCVLWLLLVLSLIWTLFYFQGRALGITLGCLLGMTPLLFLGKKKDESNEESTWSCVQFSTLRMFSSRKFIVLLLTYKQLYVHM